MGKWTVLGKVMFPSKAELLYMFSFFDDTVRRSEDKAHVALGTERLHTLCREIKDSKLLVSVGRESSYLASRRSAGPQKSVTGYQQQEYITSCSNADLYLTSAIQRMGRYVIANQVCFKQRTTQVQHTGIC